MKKNIFYLFIALILVANYSCDEKDWSYNEGAFIAFKDNTVQGKESLDSILIPVLISDNGRKETIEVTFELTPAEGVAEGLHYNLLNASNTLTFAPGVGVEYIRIEPVNDLTPEDDKSIQLTITSNSKNYSTGLPGPDKNQTSCELIIKEDDCPLTLDLFSGRIEGLEDSPWWTDSPGKYEWTPVAEIEPGKIEYKISGWFYPQLLTSNWNWYESESEIEFLPVTVILDVTDPANPKYSMLEEPAFTVPAEDWGYDMKPVDNQPLNIDVCGKYVEIPYTLLGSSWVHNYVFTVKFQFE